MLQEIDLVKLQVARGELRIKMVELFHRIAVHTDCIRRFVVRGQILLKQASAWFGCSFGVAVMF